ncbi:hypothetical protein B0A48_16643 [Cryoendolithus antarcticus]|uniref:Erythromycin biosynthesis protein CIII-like C-terminal domain-containing protein n=1 Tax=Cryoendolithus antarcticus TaxID=1507870 RepID=A0A1V8SEU4_9PEZI|nr:hypothetical protein B0A48_16643 [Cryoendolithus antarcticus]
MGSLPPQSDIHIVYIAVPGYGHVRPLRSLAKSLSKAGYNATFVTGDAFQDSLECIPNVDFHSFQGKANFHPERVFDSWPERAQQPQDATLAVWDIEHVFFGCMDGWFNAMQTVLTRPELAEKRVVIITDGFQTGVLPISLDTPQARRVPVLAIANFPIVALSKDTPPFGFGLPSQGEEKNEELNKMVEQAFSGVSVVAKSLLQKYNCKREMTVRTPMDYMFHTPEAYLQLTVPQMEHPRTDSPPGFAFIGTLLGANDNRGFPSWWHGFVVNDSSKPLVVVTSGTVASMDAHQLIIPTIEACRDLPVRLVVCAVNAPIPENYDLPGNVRVATWLPFEDLFKHAAIVVTNGGYGGINQAFAAGLPMVLAGLTEDKIETTARAANTGAAINLKTQTPSVEQVRDALKTVLEKDSYRAAAKELQKTYTEYDTVGIIEKTILELVERFYS